MFCQNCGSPASGNYCTNCGAKLTTANQDLPAPNTSSSPALSWKQETTLEGLLSNPEVREMIADSAAQSTKQMSGEEFLGVADSLIKPLGKDLSLKKLAEIVVPIFQDMGIKNEHSMLWIVRYPILEVTVKAICTMARNNCRLTRAKKAANGIVLLGTIPSDFWSWSGDLVITLEDLHPSTRVQINTKIKGQLYDWGKSKRIIHTLLRDIENPNLLS
jgi:hypothetical protein